MLAAKAALAIRVDALGEESTNELGIQNRARLEARLKNLEEGGIKRISGAGKQFAKTPKFENKFKVITYKDASDIKSTPINKRKTFDNSESEHTADDIDVKKEETTETEIIDKPAKKKKKHL